MGISVKWTFENESIFYAGEPLIIYLTFSCTADEKKPQPLVQQQSFLSSVMGIFSPSSSVSSTSPIKKLPVEAENCRRKSLMFLPKSQKFTCKSPKLPELDPEEEIQGEIVKIHLSNSNDAIDDSKRSQINSTSFPNSGIPNGKHKDFPPDSSSAISNISFEAESKLQGQKPPILRKLSAKEGEMNVAVGGEQEIAWIFAQMTGNFKVDDLIVKMDQIRSLENKITYRIDGGTGGGVIGGGVLAGSNTNLGSPSQPRQKKVLESFPIYSTPPSIIATNLSLKAGESVTFRYEILLPPVIPPSFHGKCSRFSYRLILGIQRANLNLKCNVIKIPIRIFNRTNDDGSRHIYEILNPIMMTVDESITQICGGDFKTIEELKSPKRNIMPPGVSLPSLLNIQQVCSHSQRVSYDICKNNEHIAKLILLRGAYRLGDSVVGLIYFDKSSVPTIETSVYLETVETVDPKFSLKSKADINSLSLKRFSEMCKFTLQTKRMGFVLALPIDGCPDFQTTAVGYSWHLRFEFITGVDGDLYTPFINEENFVESHAKQFISSESFDCIIPIKVYGVRKGLRKWKSQNYDIQ